jgi:putative membrane protein
LINLPFLAALMAGMVIAVLTFAPGIEWMLVNQPVLIWSFFFGLVLASVVVVAQRVSRWSLLLGTGLLAGTVFAYFLVGMVPLQTPTAWWFLMLSGALAICAMILPGISGSFILLLLGKYQFFVAAVNQRELMPIIWAGIGAAAGLVSFAQLLSWLFRRYHDLTVAVLTGFMLGSLRKVWPWKEVLQTITDRHGDQIPIVERNVLPAFTANGVFNTEIAFALGMAVVGMLVVLLIERLASNSDRMAQRAEPGKVPG